MKLIYICIILVLLFDIIYSANVDLRGLLGETTSAENQAKVAMAISEAMKDGNTMILSAEEGHQLLQDPNVKEALNSKTPDAVDRLIQGILTGTGKGGVVTNEFNRPGVHATIISNVNELKVEQLDNTQEERYKAVKKLEDMEKQQSNRKHEQL